MIKWLRKIWRFFFKKRIRLIKPSETISASHCSCGELEPVAKSTYIRKAIKTEQTDYICSLLSCDVGVETFYNCSMPKEVVITATCPYMVLNTNDIEFCKYDNSCDFKDQLEDMLVKYNELKDLLDD